MKNPEARLETKNDVKEFLNDQLQILSERYPEKTILILLDSIDQLSTSDYDIDWYVIFLSKFYSHIVFFRMLYSKFYLIKCFCCNDTRCFF